MQSWLYLICAVFLEVAGTSCMKLSNGFTRPGPSVLIFFFYGLSFTALTFALKKIDVSVAYAVWSGIGTATIAVIGFTYFKESMSLLKMASLCLIIIGVMGLNLSGARQ